MDEILKKLGVYDLVAVLLTGICINVLTYLTIDYLFPDIANKWIVRNDLIIFGVSSYLLGVIFQEIGSLINSRTIDKDNKLLKRVFDDKKDKEKYSLTKEEISEVNI